MQKHELPKDHPLPTPNYYLHKWHKLLAVLLVGFTFLHYRFSSQKLGLNWRTCRLIIIVLLFFNFIHVKKRKKSWTKGHRILTVVFCAVLLRLIIVISIRSMWRYLVMFMFALTLKSFLVFCSLWIAFVFYHENCWEHKQEKKY